MLFISEQKLLDTETLEIGNTQELHGTEVTDTKPISRLQLPTSSYFQEGRKGPPHRLHSPRTLNHCGDQEHAVDTPTPKWLPSYTLLMGMPHLPNR